MLVKLLLVLVVSLRIISGSKTSLFERVRESEEDDLSLLITALSSKLGVSTYDGRSTQLNCLAALVDPLHHHVLSGNFFKRLGKVPVYKIFISESEDLISPNYVTLSSIRQARKQGCKAYLILLANGLQLARFLRFVDR